MGAQKCFLHVFLFKSAIELRELICSKKISPVEITNLALERIEEINPKTNAFLTVTADSAIEKAKENSDVAMIGIVRDGVQTFRSLKLTK